MSIDTGTELVQAYLQVNGYFTVADYPLVEMVSPEPARSVTDVDLLAVRFPSSAELPARQGTNNVRGTMVLKPDQALNCPASGTDMIVAEVKQALDEWSIKSDGIPDGQSVCHLIESIATN